MPVHLPPASEKLLREIATHDAGNGVLFRHAARARYKHPHTGTIFNRSTFFPLTANDLVDDGGSDHTPVRITDAGRQHLAELDAATTPSTQPTAESDAAQKLLRAIAASTKPTLIYSGSPRTIWRLGRHDGPGHRAATYGALEKAGYIDIEYQFAGGKRVAAIAAGRARLEHSPDGTTAEATHA
jgi:hypothetical protein